MKRPVVLVGFSGSGKSTVAQLLGAQPGVKAVDLDRIIEVQIGCSIAEYIRVEGEAEFRRREAEALAEAVKQGADIISAGGGILTVPETREYIESECFAVQLAASPEVIVRRMLAESTGEKREQRPLLFAEGVDSRDKLRERIAAMLEARSEGYSSAKLTVVTDYAEGADCADAVMRWSSLQKQAKLSVIPARFSAESQLSEIVVGDGVSSILAEAVLLRLKGVKRVAVVTDTHIAGDWLDSCVESLRAKGFEPLGVTIEAGESAKKLTNVENIASQLLSRGFTRSDLVVAMGGGMIGDLAGLTASLFMRGVPLVQLPTTLLAQVDSAIGGKTGVNLEGGKNSLGTFYPATLVLSDPAFFSTLPDREFRSGMAEVVKYGLIWSAQFLDWIEQHQKQILARDAQTMRSLVESCSRAKLDFVMGDLTDSTGRRAILNFGHTVGHAIEKLAGYGELLHGEAVSIGMAFALRFSTVQGWTAGGLAERVERLLAGLGLPTRLPRNISLVPGEAAPEKEHELKTKWTGSLQADKKRVSDVVSFIVVETPGQARLESVSVASIVESLSNLKCWGPEVLGGLGDRS